MIVVDFVSVTGVTDMKDKFKVHVYRDSNLRKDDLVFEWEGELSYILVNSDSYIHITDWSNFEQMLHETKISKYHPVAFWRHDSEGGMFEIGQANIVNKKPYITIL